METKRMSIDAGAGASATTTTTAIRTDPNKFRVEQCRAALIHHDLEHRFEGHAHYKQLLTQFGVVWSKRELQDSKELPPAVQTVFLCGSCRDIVPSILAKTPEARSATITLVPMREWAYHTEVADEGLKLSAAVSYRSLALRIPGLESTNDRLVPLGEDEDWYNTLKNSQEWYELMHANHQDAPALRTGTYCSASGPVPRSVWLQRCSTVFREATQVFGDEHQRLQTLQRQADSVCLSLAAERDPNIMLIQRYEPTAIIGAHSDKTVDLDCLVFRAFSAYEGFSSTATTKGRFDDKNIGLDPADYRVWLKNDPASRGKPNARGLPVIRFLTLRRKENGTTLHVPLPPNWMFIMTDLTHRQWTHEIRKQPSARNRISVTSRFSATLAQYEDTTTTTKTKHAEESKEEHKEQSQRGAATKAPTTQPKVQLYRATPGLWSAASASAAAACLDPIGALHLADREESRLIDEAYKEQNIVRDRLPDYSRLCTRNPGDLQTPPAFLKE